MLLPYELTAPSNSMPQREQGSGPSLSNGSSGVYHSKGLLVKDNTTVGRFKCMVWLNRFKLILRRISSKTQQVGETMGYYRDNPSQYFQDARTSSFIHQQSSSLQRISGSHASSIPHYCFLTNSLIIQATSLSLDSL